jgi:hypothetical protein
MKGPWTHKVKYQRLWLREREEQPKKVIHYIGSDGAYHSYYEDDTNIVKLRKPKT